MQSNQKHLLSDICNLELSFETEDFVDYFLEKGLIFAANCKVYSIGYFLLVGLEANQKQLVQLNSNQNFQKRKLHAIGCG